MAGSVLPLILRSIVHIQLGTTAGGPAGIGWGPTAQDDSLSAHDMFRSLGRRMQIVLSPRDPTVVNSGRATLRSGHPRCMIDRELCHCLSGRQVEVNARSALLRPGKQCRQTISTSSPARPKQWHVTWTSTGTRRGSGFQSELDAMNRMESSDVSIRNAKSQ